MVLKIVLPVLGLFVVCFACAQVSCPPNLDFEQGNFNHWTCYTGSAYSLNGTNKIQVSSGAPVFNRHEIMSGSPAQTPVDPYGGFPVVCPYGSGHSIKLGNDNTNGEAERVSYLISIPANQPDYSITYYYAVVFEDAGHQEYEQPRFTAKIYYDNTDSIIDCASYEYIATSKLPGFKKSEKSRAGDPAFYKDWAPVTINLSRFAGKSVRLEFTTADCTKRGHFGYAYVDIECTSLITGATYCEGKESLVLNAPHGFQYYKWWNDDFSSKIGDSASLYMKPPPPNNSSLYVELIPFPGFGCRDTVQTTIKAEQTPAPFASDTSYCQFETPAILTATTLPGYKALWYTSFTGNERIPDGTMPQTDTAGEVNYYVSQISPGGCEGPRTKVSVNVFNPPSIKFFVAPLELCIDDSIQFINQSDTLTSVLWDFGDGNNSTLFNPIHSYSTPGVYQVKLTGIRQHNVGNFCSESSTQQVTVVPRLPGSLLVSDSVSSCVPFTVLFTNQSAPSIQTVWDFGNGMKDTGDVVTHTFTKTGIYQVKMTALDPGGCTYESIKSIKVQGPEGYWKYDNGYMCSNAPVRFEAFVKNADSLRWHFGDGNILVTKDNVIYHTYDQPGEFLPFVELLSSPNASCSVILQGFDTIKVDKVSAGFSTNENIQCGSSDVGFVDSSRSFYGIDSWSWEFGDGTASTDHNPQHQYGFANTWPVSLVVQSKSGCRDTVQTTIKAEQTPAPFASDTSYCQFETPAILTATTLPGYKALWYTSFTGNERIPDGTMPQTDTAGEVNYYVSQISPGGCEGPRAKVSVNVFNPPSIKFFVAPLELCIDDSIQFINQSDTLTSVLWDFGDGNNSTLFNPIHRYNTPGVYQVKLTGIRQHNVGNFCSESSTQQVTVVPRLPGSLLVSDSVSSCVPFTVLFTNQSAPSIQTVWDFGNGIKDTGDVVTHTFTKTGIYQVKMTALDPGGCTYESIKSIKVQGPEGYWKYDNGYMCSNAPVRFEAFVKNADSLRWHFGDGNILVTKDNVIYHTYDQPGEFLPFVELLSGPNAGCSVILQGFDTIKVDKVSAGFSTNENIQCGSSDVGFVDSSRSFYGIDSWSWEFGDGTASTDHNPQHQYGFANTWPVSLVVQSKSGCTDTVRQFLQTKINSKPVADIIADSIGCSGTSVLYSASITSQDLISFYSWEFSNGLKLTGKDSVNISYSSAATYRTVLTVGTVEGCYDTSYHDIIVEATPQVKIGDDITICKGQSIQLRATGAFTYQWSPANGSLSCMDCSSPVATPVASNLLVVTGTNSLGCNAKDSVYVTVAQPISINVTGNDSICSGQSVRLSATGADNYTWSYSDGIKDINSASPVVNPSVTTYYTVIGTDTYNCFSDTANVTIVVRDNLKINLGEDKNLPTGTVLPLTNTVTGGPVTAWKWGPAQDISCISCPEPLATIKKSTCYNVTATNAYGCTDSDTVCIKVFCESSQVLIPSAFTPNHDGRNDILVVRGKGIKTITSFRIFNRWGQVVFERSNFAPNDTQFGWNGTVNGIPASIGVYVYTCEVVCENDIPFTYKGNVAILK